MPKSGIGWVGKAPSSKPQRSSKFQTQRRPRQLGLPATVELLSSMRGRFGAWWLQLLWYLEIGIWSFKMPKPTVGTAAPTQSGDSEDSVAAVQDARAPTRAALGSWPQRR